MKNYFAGKRMGKLPSSDQFKTADYLVVGAVLVISAVIGIYYRITGGKQQTNVEYLLAGRSMGAIPVAFSLMASFMSAITLLGVTMEMYQYGTQFLIINLAYIIGTPIVTNFILPVFYQLKTASIFEYLEARFGYATRLIASIAFTIQMTLYMSIVLYAPALALEVVSGINLTLSISVIGIVCTFYATLGGMKAVLVTDVFQALLMFASIFSVIIVAMVKAKGISLIWMTAKIGGRLEIFNFSVDPTVRHTWFTQIIGGLITYLAIYGANQTQVQRLLSTRSMKSARTALWLNLPILILLSLSTCFAGLCIYYYYENCDPLLDERVTSRDQLLPRFIMDTMNHLPGLAGLCVAGIFSGSLSTISSAISSLTAVTLEDYVKPILTTYCGQRELNEFRTALYSKIISISYGMICILLAFLAGSLGGLLQASLSILGLVGGPILGLFTLGMCVTVANQKGAIVGLLMGLFFSAWVGFGGPKPTEPILPVSMDNCHFNDTRFEIFIRAEKKLQYGIHFHRDTYENYFHEFFYLYRISYMWYSVLGFLVTVIVGILMSTILHFCNCDNNNIIYENGSRKRRIRTELFIPPIANWLIGKQTRNSLSRSKDMKADQGVNSYTLNDAMSSTYDETFHQINDENEYYNNASYIDDERNRMDAGRNMNHPMPMPPATTRITTMATVTAAPPSSTVNALRMGTAVNNTTTVNDHRLVLSRASPMYNVVDDDWDTVSYINCSYGGRDRDQDQPPPPLPPIGPRVATSAGIGASSSSSPAPNRGGQALQMRPLPKTNSFK